MASKRAPKSSGNEELDSLFEGITDEKPAAASKKTTTSKAKGAASKSTAGKAKAPAVEKDILADLEEQLGGEQVSRPHTPRISKDLPTRGSPAPAASRRSVESSKAYSTRNSTDERAPSAPVAVESAPAQAAQTAPVEAAPAASSGGGWWGGIISTASAAMKQAEAAVKEIQQNEEAKKWADQVRGNVVSLRGFGDELRHRALPTFTNILHTLAPPIASHERLLIHITHDMVGYPSLDPLVHGVFTRVMAQVEGGDLLVIQRGQESQSAGSTGSGSAGWRDGPWWRVVHHPRDLGAVPGLHEGTKLCRASAEAYANEYYAAHYGSDDSADGTAKSGSDRAADSKRGLEVARQRAIEPVSEANPVRHSDIFLAVQAFTVTAESKDDEETDESDESDDLVQFAIHIRDPVHDIVYHTVSQALPAKWVRWLDAKPSTLTPATSGGEGEDDDDASDRDYDVYGLPDDIREIVDSGAVDPREWVAEWIEETLTLAVGVVAQRYVARRMGVGAGSIGRGKRPVDEVLADNAGEAARAGLI
ncbi:hypothetical protein Sste5346_002097 [Sporothrix stenoceras]|uniref:Maintenance of telomere capping protein 1 n=1 Tax=Sporothrix stenoceras TaxID=5173 RepID=A0ABR3ZLR8_9PEZI